MKKNILTLATIVVIALSACKGNGSTSTSSDGGKADSVDLNDGTGAPGSGTGSAGAGTVGDTTHTPQDTTHGAPVPTSPDTMNHK